MRLAGQVAVYRGKSVGGSAPAQVAAFRRQLAPAAQALGPAGLANWLTPFANRARAATGGSRADGSAPGGAIANGSAGRPRRSTARRPTRAGAGQRDDAGRVICEAHSAERLPPTRPFARGAGRLRGPKGRAVCRPAAVCPPGGPFVRPWGRAGCRGDGEMPASAGDLGGRGPPDLPRNAAPREPRERRRSGGAPRAHTRETPSPHRGSTSDSRRNPVCAVDFRVTRPTGHRTFTATT